MANFLLRLLRNRDVVKTFLGFTEFVLTSCDQLGLVTNGTLNMSKYITSILSQEWPISKIVQNLVRILQLGALL